MSDSATEVFDHHHLWDEIEGINSWISEASTKFGPEYEGLSSLANSLLSRIQIAVETTRLYLQLAPKEAISKALLDELKSPLARINVELQNLELDSTSDFDKNLSAANDAADVLLSGLNKLSPIVSAAVDSKVTADQVERDRISSFLDDAQSIVASIQREFESYKETISGELKNNRNEITDLQQEVEDFSGSYKEQIDEGVEAGKKRIDDQITTLQNQYNSQVELQSKNATESLNRILEEIKAQKEDLDKMVEETQRVSGYIAENEMSRLFKERADDSRALWIGFIIAGVFVSVVSAIILWNAGQNALESTATSADIVRGIIRILTGLGSAAIAAYLFRQASIQQSIFQDFRSAEVRLGSLDAFLARFDQEDAQEVRRGVGKRVYIDGELGEIESQGDASLTQSKSAASESTTLVPPKSETTSKSEE
ncbi:hypothetical protein [Corynebacterium stationis]|uniref:hypothetical protein n=1 Tax=Corynebacterium stationis TaxID=1705 RepID=UPI0028A92AE6|nr:hypothetical protein [Corynebacterium stationis]